MSVPIFKLSGESHGGPAEATTGQLEPSTDLAYGIDTCRDDVSVVAIRETLIVKVYNGTVTKTSYVFIETSKISASADTINTCSALKPSWWVGGAQIIPMTSRPISSR